MTSIIKNYVNENPPYTSANYAQTFDISGGVYDLENSYINLYCDIQESYAQNGNTGGIANVGIGQSKLGDVYFRSVRLTSDKYSDDIFFTQNLNVLNATMNIYKYNSNQQDMQTFLASETVPYYQPNLSSDLLEDNILFSSNFRELYNNGNVMSKRYLGVIRVGLFELLGQMKLSDFRGQSLKLYLEFDISFAFTAEETSPPYVFNGTVTGGLNSLSYLQLGGANIMGTFAGANNDNVFTLTAGQNILASTFPFDIGDSVTFTTLLNRNITDIGPADANGYLTTITVDGNASANAGDTLVNTSVPRIKVVYLNQTNAVVNSYGIVNDVQLGAVDADVVLDMSDYTVTQIIPDATNTFSLCILNEPLPALNFFANSAYSVFAGVYFASGGVNANIPSGTVLTSSLTKWTNYNFMMWLGSACYVYGSAGVTLSYCNLNTISYNNGAGVDISLNGPIRVTANAGVLFITNVMANDLTVSYNRKTELVLNRYMDSLIKDKKFNNKYKKNVSMGAIIPVLPANSLYETTFSLPRNTVMVMICVCDQNTLLPNISLFSSYRILIDGVDPNNRLLLLNSVNKTFMIDKLINGFSYLDDELNNIIVNVAELTKFISNVNENYVILQDIMPVDYQKVLTLQLNVGNAAIANAMNIYLFAKVLSEL
jgi:molybdopterin-binding protein